MEISAWCNGLIEISVLIWAQHLFVFIPINHKLTLTLDEWVCARIIFNSWWCCDVGVFWTSQSQRWLLRSYRSVRRRSLTPGRCPSSRSLSRTTRRCSLTAATTRSCWVESKPLTGKEGLHNRTLLNTAPCVHTDCTHCQCGESVTLRGVMFMFLYIYYYFWTNIPSVIYMTEITCYLPYDHLFSVYMCIHSVMILATAASDKGIEFFLNKLWSW